MFCRRVFGIRVEVVEPGGTANRCAVYCTMNAVSLSFITLRALADLKPTLPLNANNSQRTWNFKKDILHMLFVNSAIIYTHSRPTSIGANNHCPGKI